MSDLEIAVVLEVPFSWWEAGRLRGNDPGMEAESNRTARGR